MNKNMHENVEEEFFKTLISMKIIRALILIYN